MSNKLSLELAKDEELQWQWTHDTDGRRAITGYTIVKQAEQD